MSEPAPAAGTDAKGRGLPAPVVMNTTDPEAADQVATGKRSESAKVTSDTNQLVLQATEDSRYDPPPVDRKVKDKFTNYRAEEIPMQTRLATLSLLLVAAVLILKY
jgi:hypothetical protein